MNDQDNQAAIEAYVAHIRARALASSGDVGRAEIAAGEARAQATGSYGPEGSAIFEAWRARHELEQQVVSVMVPRAPMKAQVTQAQVREALEVSGYTLATEGPLVVPGSSCWIPPTGAGMPAVLLYTRPRSRREAQTSISFAVEELALFHGVYPDAMLTEIVGAAIGEWTEKPSGDSGHSIHVLRYADGAHAAMVNPGDGWHAFGRDGHSLAQAGLAEGDDIDEAKRLARAALVGRKLSPEKPDPTTPRRSSAEASCDTSADKVRELSTEVARQRALLDMVHDAIHVGGEAFAKRDLLQMVAAMNGALDVLHRAGFRKGRVPTERSSPWPVAEVPIPREENRHLRLKWSAEGAEHRAEWVAYAGPIRLAVWCTRVDLGKFLNGDGLEHPSIFAAQLAAEDNERARLKQEITCTAAGMVALGLLDAVDVTTRAAILHAVREEDQRQVAKGRDAAYDDERMPRKWLECLHAVTNRIDFGAGILETVAWGRAWRRMWVKVARLAFAAIGASERSFARPARTRFVSCIDCYQGHHDRCGDPRTCACSDTHAARAPVELPPVVADAPAGGVGPGPALVSPSEGERSTQPMGVPADAQERPGDPSAPTPQGAA